MEKHLDRLEESLLKKGYKRGKNRAFGKASQKDIDQFSKNFNDKFSPELVNLLIKTEGFNFSWDWFDPNWEGLNGSGRIHWPGITKILKGDAETLLKPYGAGYEGHLWTLSFNTGWEERFDSYLLIDDLGLGNAILMEPETQRLGLWLFNRGFFQLTMLAVEYFDLAFKWKGLHLWQYWFIESRHDFPSEIILNHQLIVDRLLPELEILESNALLPNYLVIAKEKQYIRRLELVDERRLEISVDYDDADGNHGAPLPIINKILLQMGPILTDDILAYFSTVGTYTYTGWRCKTSGGHEANMNYFMYGLRDMFCGYRLPPSNTVVWDFNTFKYMNFGEEEEDDPAYDKLKRMWTFYWEEGCQVCFKVSDRTGKLELVWSWDIPDFVPLQVNFETFVEGFLASGGLQSWVFHLEPEAQPYKLVPFEAPLKEIFPNADTSMFHFHS